MDRRPLICECGEEFNEDDFAKHFGTCTEFKMQFKDFDQKFGELLKAYSEPKERLRIVKFLLKQYINVIEQKLKQYFSKFEKKHNSYHSKQEKNSNILNYKNQKEINSKNPIRKNKIIKIDNEKKVYNKTESNNKKNILQNQYDDEDESEDEEIEKNSESSKSKNSQNQKPDFLEDFEPQQIDEDEENEEDENENENENNEIINEKKKSQNLCQICKKSQNLYRLKCSHSICKNCLTKKLEKKFYEAKCKICSQEITEDIKSKILGKKLYDELESNAVKGLIGNIIQCPNPKCKEQIAFEPGKIDYNVKDEQNKKLSKIACEDYAKHRCRCGFCQINFCTNCLSIPYHLGKTCEEFKHHIIAKKCRFCDTEIKNKNKGPDIDVCNNIECTQKYEISCKKHLICGHKCFGVKTEKQCPPCLDKNCENYGGLFDQDKDLFCNICFIEGLGSSPIVVLSCGHYVHYLCIKKRLENKWIGPKITFNHCLCPVCNKWFDCPTVPEIKKMINYNKKLYENIKEMAIKRLKYEGLDKDPRLLDKNSPWYNKKEEFAMKRLSYYMCYICKKPYFAGRRECGNNPAVNDDDPNKNYDPKDCVCGKDANLSGIAGVTNCPKHGREFIEYKCRYCCKIASWFCWGNTHFCDSCHRRQCNHDYVSKYPKDKLPKCNPKTCEVGGNHPPNGEEFALGCSICRNSKEDKDEPKDF